MSEQADWLRAYALMGTYLGEQVQIALGPGGLFYAVLRGQGPTGLQTVKVDEDGRLSAFVIDSSDAWGQLLGVGNAELAARLGSVVKYDRRGQVILHTDFSTGWGAWRTSTSGSGTTVALDPTAWHEGGYSVKCTSGGISTANVYLLTWLPVLPVATAGLAVFFSIPSEARYIDLVIQADDTANRPQGRLRYDVAGETLEIVNSAGAWAEVASGVPIKKHQQSFNYMKLVIDGENDTYLRALFNDQEIDLSAYGSYMLATLGYSHLYLGIWTFMREDQADIVYLDCPVVTINEPT